MSTGSRSGPVLDDICVVASTALALFTTLWLVPQSGRFTSSVAMAGGLVILTAVVCGWMFGWLIGRRSTRTRRSRASAVLAAVAMGALVFWITRPPQRLRPPVSVPADVTFWDLSTGSRIAYAYSPAKEPRRASPLVVLHGGPGMPHLPLLRALGGSNPLEPLTAAGFDVYFYDQYGGGYSSRADLTRDPRYTVARHVEDLEAIRRTLRVERLNLLGLSWGATLAANYVLRYPDMVDHVIFDSPGPIWIAEYENFTREGALAPLTDPQRAELDQARRATPRIIVGRALGAVNISLATAFVPDWEVDQWWSHQVQLSDALGQPRQSCRDESMPREFFESAAFFVSTFTWEDGAGLPDPRPELRKHKLPVLVLRGECDWIKPEVAAEYRDVFGSAQVVALAGEGHGTWFMRPAVGLGIVKAFLTDQELPAVSQLR
jgi:pimeloyl-ACP methyl ester carboxylesterase